MELANQGKRQVKLKIAAIASVSAIALFSGPTVTFAAEAAAAATANSVSLEEVTVTARKRAQAEILQQAPITATVVTGKELVQANSVNLLDVGHMSPGVSFQGAATRSAANFSVRGVGISGTTASDAPAVGVFQDGVYWGTNFGSLGEMFDIAHIDILRGPQGTLFGRNVSGGAVVIESNRPTYTPSLTLGAGYGSGNTIEGSIIANGALYEDKVAGRLAISGRRSDGQFKWGGPGGGRFGREDMLLVRPSVVIDPTENLEIVLRGEYYTQTGDPIPIKGVAPTNYINGVARVITASEANGYVMPSDWTTIYNAPRGSSETTTGLLAGEVHYKLPVGELIYISAYRRAYQNVTTSFSGTRFTTFLSGGPTRQTQYSNELRYAADFGTKANFTAGLYQFHQQFSSAQFRATTATPLAGLPAPLYTRSDLTGEEAYGIYAEGDYHFTDQLTLTLGGRYSSDKKHAKAAPFGACTADFVCTFGGIFSADSNKFTPKVGLNYKITPANMVYASYTQGIRDGGYSLRATVLTVPYLPEVVDAYEIGSKNDFFDHRLRVNVAIYDQKYTNIQKTVTQVFPPPIGILQLTQNAARADIKGFEVSTNWQVTSDFRIDANYGYVHARYQELTPGFITAIAYPGVTASKLRFNRVPVNTGNLILNYNHQIDGGAVFFARASASFQSSYYFDDRNSILQKGFTLYDASAGYTFPSGKTTLSVWGKNLSNQEHYEWGSNGGVLFENEFAAPPRTYGVKVSRTFD